MEIDSEKRIDELNKQIEILKGAARQSNLILKRYQDGLAIVRRQKLELRKNKAKVEEELNFLKKMKDKLVEQEKMASLGSLVAGVAHDINTPVGVAISSASFCEKELLNIKHLYEENKISEEDMEMFLETAEESIKIVMQSLEQAAKLIRSFKQISVDQNIDDMRQINISEYIYDIIRTFHNQLKKTRIKVEIDCPDHLLINTYPGSISQIMNNLLSNTLKHAFSPHESGRIFIQIRLDNDQFLHILFADNGKGMDDEIKKQAFDPFVTTSRDRGGSGLGLNIVYNLVVHRFKGEIKLESEKGKGSKFIIVFHVEEERT